MKPVLASRATPLRSESEENSRYLLYEEKQTICVARFVTQLFCVSVTTLFFKHFRWTLKQMMILYKQAQVVLLKASNKKW